MPGVTTTLAPSPGLLPLPLRGAGDDTPKSVLVNTRGSDLLVVRVPVPGTVRWDGVVTRRPAQFRVTTSRHVQFVGAATGTVDLQRDTAVVLALRVSRKAPAGRSLAGTVEFWVGTTSALMPIEIDVPVSHRLSLSVPARSVLASRGSWSTLSFRVLNDGNIDESATVRVAAPDGWRVDIRNESGARGTKVVAGGALAMSLRVWVPATANPGIVMLPVTLSRPDSAPIVHPVQVDVLTEASGAHNGPAIVTSFVTGQSGNAPVMHGYGVTLSGQLSDSTRVSGRFSYTGQPTSLGGAGFALARAGVLTAPPMLEVDHPRAGLRLGSAADLFPELAGQFLAGIGAIGRVGTRRVSLRAFDLRPLSLTQPFSLTARGPGQYSGGELGVDVRRARTAIFGARLVDPLSQRRLDAFGLRAGIGSPVGSYFTSEIAQRTHASGTGVGYLASGRLADAGGSAEVRVLRAPGGSRAFARASNEWQVNATRVFGRRHYLALGGWAQDDENTSLGAARSRGWYVTPSFSLTSRANIGLEARSLHFSAGTDAGRLVTDELAGGGSFNLTLFSTAVTVRSVLARIDRGLEAAALPSSSGRQWRLDHSVMAMHAGTRGSMSLAWMQQQFSGFAGVLPGQSTIQLRADRLRPFMTRSVFLDAEWQRLQIGSGGRPAWLARASLSIPLAAGASVAFAVERNPYMAAAVSRGRQPLLYSLRIDRTTILPRPVAGPRGLVFRDDNGNGRHDRRERGVAGVVVLCGGTRVITDKSGRYPCSQRQHEVDGRTIPTGLVAAKARVVAGEPIALRVVQPLVVTVRVPGVDSQRVSVATLGRLAVSARDSAGTAWSARPIGDGRFLLDALPVGRYRIELDAGAADEPLVLVGTAPAVMVSADTPADVTLDVRPRPLRIRTFAPTPTPLSSPSTTPATRDAARTDARRARVTGSKVRSRAERPAPTRPRPE